MNKFEKAIILDENFKQKLAIAKRNLVEEFLSDLGITKHISYADFIVNGLMGLVVESPEIAKIVSMIPRDHPSLQA